MKQGNLPEDFPGRAALEAADINTFAQARHAMESGEKIEGIGPAMTTKIQEALAAAELPDPDDLTSDNTAGPNPAGANPATSEDIDAKGADARTEAELRDQAQSPALKRAVDESFGEKLAHCGFCFYDDPAGQYVAQSSTVRIEGNPRIKVMPISMVVPQKGWEIRDGEDHYALTEDMGVTNFGEPGDWLKVRSPNTGLALIR